MNRRTLSGRGRTRSRHSSHPDDPTTPFRGQTRRQRVRRRACVASKVLKVMPDDEGIGEAALCRAVPAYPKREVKAVLRQLHKRDYVRRKPLGDGVCMWKLSRQGQAWRMEQRPYTPPHKSRAGSAASIFDE